MNDKIEKYSDSLTYAELNILILCKQESRVRERLCNRNIATIHFNLLHTHTHTHAHQS